VLAVGAMAVALAACNPAISLPSSGGVKQLKIVDSTGSLWRAPIANAAADWDKAPEIAITVVPGPTDAPNGTCAADPGTIRICTANYKPNVHDDGVEVRQNVDASGTVVSASVRLDNSVLNAIWGENLTNLEIDGGRRVVSCFTIGEALGLRFNHSPYSCMNDIGAFAYPASQLQHPGVVDYKAITKLYS
jgi:hypothetical protein